jgi:pyruvate,water dikinase
MESCVTVAPLELIEWLGSASGGSEALGGKGASLDTLARLGFRVPPGFCLTTAAFRTQVAAGVGAADLAGVPLVGEVQLALASAIERLVATVGSAGFQPRFAVRSSAIGEDGSATSYAGLHDTELDVSQADIPGAVRRCWASLWSPAAVAYRQRRDLPADDVAMAVVVQALVPADAAAVVFTRHPVTGRDDQLVLTAVRGLGDAMVSGTVTPDTYVVDRATRGIAQFEPGEDPAGPALRPDVLAELVELAYAVEGKLGRAVDIETAHAGGHWYLLQARPVTTGAPR